MPPPLPAAFLTAPIAHRALHDRAAGRPENSHAAIAAACAGGYGIEIDLQLSADAVPMVFHDADLERLTGQKGLIAQRSAAELSQLSLIGGGPIPTFSDVLAQVAGRTPLLVEIKDQTGVMAPTDGRLEAAAVRVLRPYRGPVALMSFNPHAVARVAALAPERARGLTTCAWDPAEWAIVPPDRRDVLRGIPDFDRVGAAFISHQARDLDRPRVTAIKAGGGPVLCWTIRSPEAERAARRIADNITFEGYRPAGGRTDCHSASE